MYVLDQKQENKVYPLKPQFFYIKVGFEGVYITGTCFPDEAWKRSVFTIMDKRIKFYSQNTNLLPPKPKSSFRHLKQDIQEFHRKYVLVPAYKAASNVVVVCRLHYIKTLKQELDGTRDYQETDTDEMSVLQ